MVLRQIATRWYDLVLNDIYTFRQVRTSLAPMWASLGRKPDNIPLLRADRLDRPNVNKNAAFRATVAYTGKGWAKL